jgi:RNA polymerase sigma factor (sigma-70 family)
MIDPLAQLPERMTEAEEARALDNENFEQVALGHTLEAVKYGRRCCRGSLQDDELVSICYQALLHSARNFKPKRGGISYFAFSKQYIRGAIAREWRKRDVVRNSSRHETEIISKTPRCHKGHWETETFEYSANQEKSGPPHHEAFQTVLPDFESLDIRERWDIIWPVMQKRLNDVERMVVVLRYKSGFSFEEIGKLRGVTRQAIQRTHAQALKKLRCALSHCRALL